MEARIVCRLVACLTAVCLLPSILSAATYQTPNFTVTARDQAFAKEVGDMAEHFRKELAHQWLGHALPRWAKPCPIQVQVGPNMGAGGVTSFLFSHGEVFGWKMSIQGPPDRILDSVLPHEVTHTIFASHFRQPLPRWADEGACTTVEHTAERSKHERMLIEFLHTDRGIAFSRMFTMKDYPADVLPLYAQGYSVSRFLIQQGGHRKFIRFLEDGMKGEQWADVTNQYYGFSNLGVLQGSWLEWVRQGCPKIDSPIDDTPIQEDPRNLLVSDSSNRPSNNLIYRVQQDEFRARPERQLVPVPSNRPAPTGSVYRRDQGENVQPTSAVRNFAGRMSARAVEEEEPFEIDPNNVTPLGATEPADLPPQKRGPQRQDGPIYYDRLAPGSSGTVLR